MGQKPHSEGGGELHWAPVSSLEGVLPFFPPEALVLGFCILLVG